MLKSIIPQFRSRLWLLGSVALALVLFMASCCPPALSKRPVEKNNRPAMAEKKNS